MYARLDAASARTGMPVNSIVIAACLEWMQRHYPSPGSAEVVGSFIAPSMATAPRWATIRRAVKLASGGHFGSAPFYPFERFTKTAQRMLSASQVEADKSGHNYIGTEHLLLGAFSIPESQAAQALAALGVEEEAVRSTLEKVLRSGKRPKAQMIVPTNRVKRVIDMAFQLCAAAQDAKVGTGHILLALSSEGEGIAAHVMNDLGAPVDRIETALEAIVEPEA